MGFLWGVFIVRLVVVMVLDLGFLICEGMEYFYFIYKDRWYWWDIKYKDFFLDILFSDKFKGDDVLWKY